MRRLIIIILIALSAVFSACNEKSIDELYTNPDAIVDVLEGTLASVEADDPNFIITDEFRTLDNPLSGTFGTTSFMVQLDSSLVSYDVTVGDTVNVDNLWAKEANAQVQYENYYTLTLKNASQQTATKTLITNPTKAYKKAYLLQLGSFSSAGRGWVYWGTTALLNLAYPSPTVTWRSEIDGTLNNSANIIYRNDFPSLQPGDKITVRYVAHSDDIAYLNINENGNPERISFSFVESNVMEASWRVSSNPSGKDYYFYAGVEIYRQKTLATTVETDDDFFYIGLMYSIATE